MKINIINAENPVKAMLDEFLDKYQCKEDSNGVYKMFDPEVVTKLGYHNIPRAFANHVAQDYVGTHSDNPDKLLVSEPGVYQLIMQSRVKAAKDFKEWVCLFVLPKIFDYVGFLKELVQMKFSNSDEKLASALNFVLDGYKFDDDGHYYTDAVSVANILDFEFPNKALVRLNAEFLVKKDMPNEHGEIYKNRLFINEGGVCQLILDSNKPEAEEFQDWVYVHVLPTIRIVGLDSTNLKQSPEEALQVMLKLKEANQENK